MAAAPGAGASSHGLTGSAFEIKDGNTVVDGSGMRDWNVVSSAIQPDLSSGAGDDSFTQGTKEDTAVPVIETGSIPPNKSDLLEFGSYVERSSSGQSFLNLFWTRVQDPSGTTNMDFEFNQRSCTATVRTGCSSNGVTPLRTVDDLLLTYDLSRGGTHPTLSLRTWTGTAWGAESPLDPALATGSINSAPVTLTQTGRTYSPRTFGEAAVNLSELLPTNVCRSFGGAYLKSRSSDSFTSALKDFIAPVGVVLSNCGRIVVHKRAGSADGALLSGAGFTADPPNSADPPTGTFANVGGPANTGAFCLDNLLLGTTYTVTESTVPAGYVGAAPQTATPVAGSCADVTAATTADLTFVNQPILGTINVAKADDVAPTANPLAGAAFTLFDDVGTVGTYEPGVDTTTQAGPTSTDGAGTLTFSNVPLGDYCVVETTTPDGYSTALPQCVTVGVSTVEGQGQTLNLSFVDPREHRLIVLVCHEGTDTLLSSAVTVAGTTLASIATAPTGMTGAALCGLGGASFGDLTHGTVGASTAIASH